MRTCTSLHASCMYLVSRDQKYTSAPLELEKGAVVIHHVGARNQIPVLSRKNICF